MKKNNATLNQSLFNCIKAIINIGASSKGDQFDETVREKLRSYLKGAKFISSEQWCSKDKNSIFKNHYKRTLNNCFDFTDLPELVDNGVSINLMIVDKPNGSQKWPDLMIVNNGIGFPIEIKSSKTDGITWNSGLPKANSLYIYNCYGKSKTTCFLGQHAISEDEIEFLKQMAKEAKALNKKYQNGFWSYYVRDMFNSNQTFFEDDNIIMRSESELIKLKEANNKLNNLIINKSDEERINKEKKKILIREEKNKKNLEKYYQDRKERLKIENETLKFLKKLTWNNKQQTIFEFNKK